MKGSVMKISLNPSAPENKQKAVKKSAPKHPALSENVVDDIITLLYNKANVNKALSNYINTLNQKRSELIAALDEAPFMNNIGSVTVHNRVSIELSESDYAELTKFCNTHKINISELIEVKTKYQPTPAFRNILLSKSDDLFIPFYDKIKCAAMKVLNVRLSL